MKNYSNIIIVLSFLLLGGLVFWQLNHLKVSQDLQHEIELQEMQSVLMESAIELRKAQNKDDDLRVNSVKKRALTDFVLKRNFKKINQDISWGFFNGNGNLVDSLNYVENGNPFLKSSPLKVCVSCLIMIDVLDPEGDSAVDKGYILDQSPSQMRDIIGLNNAEMRYLHVYVKPSGFDVKPYILPGIFLLGVALLFFWVSYLNIKQYRLIKQKNEFVNHLSHQFQTPLSSIKLSAHMLDNDNIKDKGDLIQIIQTESNRLENHIKTVLHWVKSDADRLQIDKESLSVTDIIEQSLKQMKPIFISNATKVNFIPPNEDVLVQADRNHLQLMLFNIWENAIKHNDIPVTLSITCTTINNLIQIATVDNGRGMQHTTNIKFKGLGLAYVDRIMKSHNGSMELVTTNKSGLQINLNFPEHD